MYSPFSEQNGQVEEIDVQKCNRSTKIPRAVFYRYGIRFLNRFRWMATVLTRSSRLREVSSWVRKSGMSFYIGFAEGLVEMYPTDHATEAPMVGEHGLDIVKPLLLAFQIETAVHQMSRIQQDPLIAMVYPFQQLSRLHRLRRGKAGLPLVFHQEGKRPPGFIQQGVDQFQGGGNDLSIAVGETIGKAFLQGDIGYMKDHISGLQDSGPL